MLIKLRTRLPSFLLPFIVCSLILVVPTLLYLRYNASPLPQNDATTSISSLAKEYAVGDEVHGGVIMPKLANETAKAELGRATWKLLHTMAQRYPEHPTVDQKSAFRSYFYLLSRLYPCGECAAHFQLLLKDYPPQTSSQKAAAMWLCGVHNRVNERLGKADFDCNNLEGLYDCGCGEEDANSPGTTDGEISLYQSMEDGYITYAVLVNAESHHGLVDPLTGEDLIPG